MASPVFPVAEEDLHLCFEDILAPHPATASQEAYDSPPNAWKPLLPVQRRETRGNRKKRVVFSAFQLDVLETTFQEKQRPTYYEAACLASLTELEEDRVQQWFRNRRAKRKRENAENIPPAGPSTSADAALAPPHKVGAVQGTSFPLT